MGKKVQVEGHKHLYKDPDTGVIVNRDTSDRERYRVAKRQAKANIEAQEQIQELREEVKELSELVDEVSELKDLLKQLLSK